MLAVPALRLPLDRLLGRPCSILLVEIGLCAPTLLGQAPLIRQVPLIWIGRTGPGLACVRTCPILLIEVGLRAAALLH